MARNAPGPAGPGWNADAWNGHLRDVTVLGRRIHCLDVGEGPALLLVHGLGASWQAWYRNIADLAVSYRVLAVDLPGFGNSQALARPAGIRDYADSLAAFLDLLAVRGAVVVAHSLGGMIARSLAIRYPRQVAGLVLVSSADSDVGLRQAAQFRGLAVFSSMLTRLDPAALLFEPALAALLSVPRIRRRLIGQVVHQPRDVPADLAVVMTTSVLRSPALADAISAGLRAGAAGDPGAISCPTVVLAGRRDRLVAEAAGRRLAAMIPRARYEAWEDVGHHPMLERPAAFSALVAGLADEVRGLGAQW